MYCPKCGNEVPDVAKFCTKCGRPLPKPAEPTQEAIIKPLQQVELPPASSSIVKSMSPILEPARPGSAKQKEAAPSPAEQSRAQMPSIAPDLLALSRQVGFLLTGLGTLVVLIAFFLGWFHVSSPIANVVFSGLVAFDMSGIALLTGYPDLGLPGSPAVALVPLFALFALAVNIPRIKQTKAGNYSRVIQIGVGMLGIAYMLIMLLGTRALYESAFRKLGLPPMLSQKIISLDPAIGFWLTLLGFVLIIGDAILNWQRSR